MRAKGHGGEEKTHQRQNAGTKRGTKDKRRTRKARGVLGKSGGKERNSQMQVSESV